MKPAVFAASKMYIIKMKLGCQGDFYNMFTIPPDHKM